MELAKLFFAVVDVCVCSSLVDVDGEVHFFGKTNKGIDLGAEFRRGIRGSGRSTGIGELKVNIGETEFFDEVAEGVTWKRDWKSDRAEELGDPGWHSWRFLWSCTADIQGSLGSVKITGKKVVERGVFGPGAYGEKVFWESVD